MDYQGMFPAVEKLNGKKASFLLGTDQYIGEGLDKKGNKKLTETRVGVVPEQVAAIKSWLESNGVAFDFYFVKGAGSRADFLDTAYLKIGGQVLFEHQLSTMPAPNVVHALKEPCAYETFIPGPFLRIGALHSGAFEEESGVAFLFKNRNFCAIFDGSNIGTDKVIPIRGSMSVFAGQIASEFCADHFNEQRINDLKIVISGGGKAGKAALDRILELKGDAIKEIILADPTPAINQLLTEEYKNDPRVKIISAASLTAAEVAGCNGLILTAVKGSSAPDVININEIKAVADKCIIVDISIDEKGGIYMDGFNRKPKEVTPHEIIFRNTDVLNGFQKNIKYVADDHLPKYKPREASIAHGSAILPYIAMLLYCAAKFGGARNAARYILNGDYSDMGKEAAELLTHLKRGLAFYNPAPIHYNASMIKDTPGEKNKTNFETFFREAGIEFGSFE
jgi:alanine dehydrogenase